MSEFSLFIEVLVSGILSGTMYSLVAVGLVLIYKASGVFNFAQGSLVLFAALSFVLLLEAPAEQWQYQAASASALLIPLLMITAIRRWFRYTSSISGVSSKPAIFSLIFDKIPFANAPILREGNVLLGCAVIVVLLLLLVWPIEAMTARPILISLAIFIAFALVSGRRKVTAAILIFIALSSLLIEIAWLRSLLCTLVLMISVAILIERFVLRPLVFQDPMILFIATLGLSYVIEGAAQGIWDTQVHALNFGIEDEVFDIGLALGLDSIYISYVDALSAVVAGILVLLLGILFHYTKMGRAFRAVADDHQAAQSVGISLPTFWGLVWACSGVVALVAGMMWGTRLGVQFSLSLLAFKALPVVLIGGFNSVGGAIVGGLIVGATEKLFEFYVGIPYLGGGTDSWSPYMLGVLFLMIKPHGLFGQKTIERI